MYYCVSTTIAALTSSATSMLNVFDYATALAVNRPLGLYTAITLHLSLGGVVVGSLLWYGVPVGTLWFSPSGVGSRDKLLARLRAGRAKHPLRLAHKLILLGVLAAVGIWQLPSRLLLTFAAVATVGAALAHYKQPLLKWAATQPRWKQVGIMMVLAWAPAGIFPCMMIIQRWKLEWRWQALVNAVIQTCPCMVLWLLAGHTVLHATAFQEGARYVCGGLIFLLPATTGAYRLAAHAYHRRVSPFAT